MRVLTTVSAALFLALTTTLSAQPIQLEARELQGGDHFTLTGSATETLLTLEVRIQDGWHMYGRPTGGGVPVNLEILEGSNFAAAGKQTVPMDEKGEIKGTVKITLPLKRTSPGDALHVRFSYMVCDALMCLPPSEVLLDSPTSAGSSRLPQLSVLLITSNDEQRNARIKAFLENNGFRCTVAGWKDVEKEECERHHIVIYDSPNDTEKTWRETSGARTQAQAFPEVKTPLIAVGFLGTRLLEAHKIAMACGYI